MLPSTHDANVSSPSSGVDGTDAFALQPAWDYLRAHEDVLVCPYLPALYAFLTHLFLCAPFFLLDALGCVCANVRKYQMSRDAGTRVLRRWNDCFWRILLNYVTAVFPVTALFQHLREREPTLPELAPSCWQLFVDVVSCLLLFDMLFFMWHYCMHRFRWLYHNIHRAHHHQNRVPIALAAQDASAAELLSLLLLALSSARLVGCHPLSEAVFHLLNSWLAVEDHCGYDLPWGLHRLLPCLGGGGAPHHHVHHRRQKGNYAPYFKHWDRLCGTCIK